MIHAILYKYYIYIAFQVSQIHDNLVAGHTGQLSLETCAMCTAGNMVRTFTTFTVYLQDPNGDWLGPVVITGSLLCNIIITTQVLKSEYRVRDRKKED